MSDHCPIRAVLKVKISLQSSTIKDNSFVDNPSILSWNKDISYRFENVLQSEEILKHFNKFLCKDIGNSQDEIDKSTKELTNILIAGAIQADQAPKFNRKVDKKAGSRRKSEKRVAHPKWHDLSCAEAHSKVIAPARLLKGSPKNSILISKLKTKTKQYNKLVKSKHKQFKSRDSAGICGIRKPGTFRPDYTPRPGSSYSEQARLSSLCCKKLSFREHSEH